MDPTVYATILGLLLFVLLLRSLGIPWRWVFANTIIAVAILAAAAFIVWRAITTA